jgi:hypothetical protein
MRKATKIKSSNSIEQTNEKENSSRLKTLKRRTMRLNADLDNLTD